MCIPMCVCVYVHCVYIHEYMCYIPRYMRTYICMYEYIDICRHRYVYTYIHDALNVSMHKHPTQAYACIHAYVCMHVDISCIHTHTCISSLSVTFSIDLYTRRQPNVCRHIALDVRERHTSLKNRTQKTLSVLYILDYAKDKKPKSKSVCCTSLQTQK